MHCVWGNWAGLLKTSRKNTKTFSEPHSNTFFNIIGISECRFENNLECMFENDRLDWKHTFLRKSRRNETKLSRYHMIILTYFCVFMWLEFIFSDCRFGIYLANLEFISQSWNLCLWNSVWLSIALQYNCASPRDSAGRVPTGPI